jgi:hypothetical protein
MTLPVAFWFEIWVQQGHSLAKCLLSEILAFFFHPRLYGSKKAVNLTENDSIHEEMCAWKMPFQMTNLHKILHFKNRSR